MAGRKERHTECAYYFAVSAGERHPRLPSLAACRGRRGWKDVLPFNLNIDIVKE